MGGDKIEKITIMVLKVDLQCSSCYKKVKKVLRKFPEIRDQVYDEKANSITIKVFCCNPEKIHDKLCYKGGGVITSIEIKEPEEPKKAKSTEPKEPEKLKVTVVDKINPKRPKPPEKPKEPEKPKMPEKPKEPEKPKLPEKLKVPEKLKEPQEKPQPQPQFPPLIVMQIQGYPHQPPPMAYCCDQCYQGYTRGPCYHHDSYKRPPPTPCYNTYSYGYVPGPVPYGLPKGCYVNKCDYFSEENASGCSIM